MDDLPRGTVTFLFTDIQGSTRLWQEFPSAMPAALALHHDVLRSAITAHNGYVFQIIGDAFCAAFATAFEGLDAALDAQRALRDAAWQETGAVRVRMALHTGAVDVRAGEFTSGEYVSGITLSRAARLLSAGHGGQILLSASSAELVREHLPSGVTLRDVGAHRLKDLVQPQQIYQVLTNDLSQEFPPLKTLDALPNNLPIQPTSFIGRERELKDIRSLFGRTHLLTLTGAGGSGKTRLALQFAADAVDEFDKGAWFIDLAPISDPALVPNAVLNALNLVEEPGRAPLDTLTDYLGAKVIFLVLDNCEHLVEACARLAHHVLTHCPNAQILATSREALSVPGEVTYAVPVLGLPDPKHLPSLEAVSQYDAVRLFIERALAIQPNFSITNSNAPAVAQICFRLDGIPLAIELAAARIKLFSPEQIAARLDDRLRLLTGGSRTVMPRQRTLRAAIEWSYSLLSEQERILFRRLAVFAGGWTFEAAEQVCRGDGLDEFEILELLSQLVNKSLVRTDLRGEETRYGMLETIREYAAEKLIESGEVSILRTRHLEFFVSFAEQAEPHLKRSEQADWVERLNQELDNFRAAFDWSLVEGHVQDGLRLGVALDRFWDMETNWREGWEHLEKLLRHPAAATRTTLRAAALNAAANLQRFLGDGAVRDRYSHETIEIARECGEPARAILAQVLAGYAQSMLADNPALADSMDNEALAIARALDDEWLLGYVLLNRGFLQNAKKDNLSARQVFEESLAHFKSCGDTHYIDMSSLHVSQTLSLMGDNVRAREQIEERLPMLRRQKNQFPVATRLLTLGEIARAENDYPLAKSYYAEGLAIVREIGGKTIMQAYCGNLGYVALFEGELETARLLFAESFALAQRLNDKSTIAGVFYGLACLAAAENKAHHAVKLFATGNAIFEMGDKNTLTPADIAEYDRYLNLARGQLTEQEFNAAWNKGRALTMEQAIELASSEISNRR